MALVSFKGFDTLKSLESILTFRYKFNFLTTLSQEMQTFLKFVADTVIASQTSKKYDVELIDLCDEYF